MPVYQHGKEQWESAGAFGTRKAAEKLADKLRKLGKEVKVVHNAPYSFQVKTKL